MVSSVDDQLKSTAKALQCGYHPCADVQWRHLGTDGFSMGASGHIPSKTTSESPGYPLGTGDSKQSPVRQMPHRAHQCPHAAIQMGPVWAYPQTPSRHPCRPHFAELLHLWGQGMARAATDNHHVHTIRGPRMNRTD